jgi:hypothetical protein
MFLLRLRIRIQRRILLGGGILSGMRELGLPSDLGVVVVVVVVFACRRT